jgi:glucose/arabinose dehydrogenase
VNAIRGGANYGFPTARTQSNPAPTPPAVTLDGVAEPSGIVTVPVQTSVFAGDLFVSSLAGQDVYRVRVTRSGQWHVTGTLLQRRYGRIAQLSASSDGALFLITSNAASWGAGRDVLVRVVAE